jgi:hypothetical protein
MFIYTNRNCFKGATATACLAAGDKLDACGQQINSAGKCNLDRESGIKKVNFSSYFISFSLYGLIV